MNSEVHVCAFPNGYCSLCKRTVCDECLYKEHFEHVENIKHQSVKVAELINYFTGIKIELDKALHLREVIQKIEVKSMIQSLKSSLINDSSQFNAFVIKHKEEVMKKIENSRLVIRIRKLYNDAKIKYEKMIELRLENKKRIKELLAGIKDGKYNSELIFICNEIDKVQKVVEKLNTLITDIDFYIKLLKELNSIESTYAQKTDKLKGVYNLDMKAMHGEGICFVQHNSSEVTVCYPLTKTYSTLKPSFKIPTNCSTIEIEDSLYVIGGDREGLFGLKVFLNTVYKVKLDGSVKSLKAFKKPRRRVAVTPINNKEIYIMGGDTFTERKSTLAQFFDTCEMLNIATNKWSARPKITKARVNIGAGTFNNRFIYLFGGYNEEEKDMDLIERLDTVDPKFWEVIKLEDDLHWNPIQTVGVIQINPREVLVFGGVKKGNPVDKCLIFKVNEKKFEKAENMKEADSLLQQHPKVIFNVVYAFGCHNGNLHIFDIKKGKWDLIKHKEVYTFKTA